MLLKSLSHHVPSLLQLELSGCPITDSSIPSLAKNCPLIECMDLSFTNVTLSSLYSLVSNCKNLITLDLSECKPADEDTYVKFTTGMYGENLSTFNRHR